MTCKCRVSSVLRCNMHFTPHEHLPIQIREGYPSSEVFNLDSKVDNPVWAGVSTSQKACLTVSNYIFIEDHVIVL